MQEVIDQAPKKDIHVVQGDWNAKIGEDANKNWKGTCGQYCCPGTNERGLRLLEISSYNNLKVVNTFGPHKPSRCMTRHSPGREYHNQIDYNVVKQRFQSSVNIAKTRSFPGADTGSDHELVMIAFRLHLQGMKNQGNIRIRFSLEKLNDPNITEIFRATIGEKFAPLLSLENQDTEIDALINSFNTAVTETVNNILGKHRLAKKSWVKDNILKLCDKQRELKNSSKKAYQFVKKLTSSKQGRTSTIQDKAGKRLTEEQDILKRWTEYYSEFYTHTTGDSKVLDVPPPANSDSYPNLLEEVEAVVELSRQVGRSGQHSIGAGPGRRRGHDRYVTHHLQ